MILQALCEYYDRKAALGEMPPYGREWKPIPYLIVINKNGDFLRLESTLEGENNNDAHKFLLPIEVDGRTSAIAPNNFYDKVSYIFGSISNKSRDRDANKAFIKRMRYLAQINKGENLGIDAVCMFYDKFNSNFQLIKKDPLFKEATKVPKTLFAFKIIGKTSVVGEDINIVLPNDKKEHFGCCLVTGKTDVPLLRLSRRIKIKSPKGLASGSVLVGFNSATSNSYGKYQGDNASISKLADFKYTTAINYLLDSTKNCISLVGDKLLFWASKDNKFVDSFKYFFEIPIKDEPDFNVENVKIALKSPLYGSLPEESNTKFYMALLCPAESRIAVKLWEECALKDMTVNIRKYFEDLDIVRGPDDKEYMPLGNLLRSISLQHKEENLPPQLFSSMMRAILEGLPFPQLLLTQTLSRIRADKVVSRNRAALLKAYLNRKRNNLNEKSINMSLDSNNNNQAYLCGRLFAIFERIQQLANPGVNMSIRDQYFDSFSCTPNVALPRLSALSIHHIQKLSRSSQVYYERLKGEVMDRLSANGLPSRFSLDDQSRFMIGYYQQRQSFFKKKEENDSEANNQQEK